MKKLVMCDHGYVDNSLCEECVNIGVDVERWIRVEDKLPYPKKLVLVYAPNRHIIGNILIGQYFSEKNGYKESWTVYDFRDSTLDEKVTHWMELPDDP